MMAEHGDSVELSDEQNLQSHLQQICLDYQNLLKKSTEMAPKGTGSKKSDPTTENHIEDDDFEEIASVADNLDSLESALDMIEERADRIREQVLELLTSNREIRQSIREENNKMRECEANEKNDTNSTSTSTDNEPTNQ